MNITRAFLAQPWVSNLGWTLIQFLWQGAILTILFAVARATFGRSMTSRGRYHLACATLAGMVAAPIATFLIRPSLPAAAPLTSWPLASANAWDALLPWLVAAWFGGVLLCSARLIGGWRCTARLRSVGTRPAPAEWQRKLQILIARIGVSQPVRLLVSSMVEVPTVVGWLRPVVLMPIGALTGLPPAHIEALLAHELAHVRRLDYLANILQCVAEAVLFYHPAVWWVSGQIRAEREMCCDDVAVSVSGDVLTYARALADLESFRPAHCEPALAANGGSLLDRILRLIGQAPAVSHTLPGPGAAAVMSLLGLLGMSAVAAHGAPVPPPAAASSAIRQPAPSAPPRQSTRSAVVSALLFGPYGPARAQQAPPAQTKPADAPQKLAHIEGKVASAAGGPVPRATVRLIGPTAAAQMCDDGGKFVFDDVSPGRYTLQAIKPGFVTGAFGSPAPGAPAPPITVESGAAMKDVTIKLTPQGVVSGQVTNQDHDPVAWASVTLYRNNYVRGRRRLASAGSAATDDEGNYRIAGLTPGRYYLAVQPGQLTPPGGRGGTPISSATWNSDADAFAAGFTSGAASTGAALAKPDRKGFADVATFYPNSPDVAGASPLDISPGVRLERIDVSIRREHVHSVKGNVVANGAPAPSAAVIARRTDSGVLLQTTVAATKDGVFTLTDLPPGTYVLRAPPVNAASVLGGHSEVTIGNSDVDNLVMSIEPGLVITGTLQLEGGELPASNQGPLAARRIRLTPDDPDGNATGAPVKEDGSFQMPSVEPGKYLVDVSGIPDTLFVKSIRFRSHDIVGAPLDLTTGGALEVVLSSKGATVSGTLRNDKGEPMNGVTMVVWPKTLNLASPTLGVKAVTTDQNGNFQVSSLPPGDYCAAGWEGEPLNSSLIQIPDLLRHLASEAATVSLAESAQSTIEPKLIAAKTIATELAKLP